MALFLPPKEKQVIFSDGKEVNLKTFSICGFDLATIVLEIPYDNLDTPGFSPYFLELLKLKLAGYQNKHGYGILPVDTYDFISNHTTVCMVKDNKAIPIMGMKSVSLERCLAHKVSFPMGDFFRRPELNTYRQATDHVIATNMAQPEKLAYNGSFTISPEVRPHKDLIKILREIIFSYLIHYYRDYNIPTAVAVALTRFKMHESKKEIGWENISLNGKELPPFACDFFFGEIISLMIARSEKVTPFGLELAKRFEKMWEARLTLGRSKLQINKRAA